MRYFFKFLSDTKLASNTSAKLLYHFLSKQFVVNVDGEKNYYVVTSQYEMMLLTRSKKLIDDFITKAEQLGLIKHIREPRLHDLVIDHYRGTENYYRPRVFCTTPLVMLLKFLTILSNSSQSKKEVQIKYSIYERFIKALSSSKILPSILTSLNAHKLTYEKNGLVELKDFAKLVSGYYRAYKTVDTTKKVVAI